MALVPLSSHHLGRLLGLSFRVDLSAVKTRSVMLRLACFIKSLHSSPCCTWPPLPLGRDYDASPMLDMLFGIIGGCYRAAKILIQGTPRAGVNCGS